MAARSEEWTRTDKHTCGDRQAAGPVTNSITTAHAADIVVRATSSRYCLITRKALADFGLAKLAELHCNKATTLTKASQAWSLAPLHLHVRRQHQATRLGARSDIFLRSEWCYEIVSGHKPVRRRLIWRFCKPSSMAVATAER